MGKVFLLDCTLRDGGYINDWRFGEENIRGFSRKIAQTGIEFYEVGFMKGDQYDPDKSVFPDVVSISNVICPKMDGLRYVAMLDMSAPIPKERIIPRDGNSIDGIRVIFKKEKIQEAYEYCRYIQDQGYFVSVNFVGTDLYTDKEFIEGIELFNTLHPFAMSIVDSFGLIKRKQFLRLVYLADNNMADGIALAYHAHNNLQQAFGNAESLVEMNLKRDLIIDACVFGMGRGAGNLNLELFAEYMNENYDTGYRIEPMLEIMDEYLNDIYKTKFWGYSLPLYLSASTGCHPNYAIYLAEKNTLAVKAFNDILKSIPAEEKASFSKERADKYYRYYLENSIDDSETIAQLKELLGDRNIVMLAPGYTLREYEDKIRQTILEENAVTIAVNFSTEKLKPDFIFSNNMRRYSKIQLQTSAKYITSSNMKNCAHTDYVINFASYKSVRPEIFDNSGVMLLRLLAAVGAKKIYLAGMDGYSVYRQNDYFDINLEHDFSKEANMRNKLIAEEISDIQKLVSVEFLTPSKYKR